MLILTDCPQRLMDFDSSMEPARVAGDLAGLSTADAWLWRVLGAAPQAFACETDDRMAGGFWRRLVVIESSPSSQLDALHDAIGAGLDLEGPTACLALAGRGFHGQRGRPWAEAPGNLFLSVALPLFLEANLAMPGLVAMPALAVAEAIRSLGNGAPMPEIKWVNDVLLDGRKVGGTLVASHSRSGKIEWAEIGIGVNIASRPQVVPTPFVPEVGCLAEFDARITLPAFSKVLLRRLAFWAERLLSERRGEILEAYRDACNLVGRAVRVWETEADELEDARPEPLASGTVRAIHGDLSLGIDGCPEPIHSGRLAFEDVCREFGL